MGRSSKKKKKHGGRRTQSKDHNSIAADSSEILVEELTALSAIFQEDCEVVSESPPQINIKLRPYSKDTGYEEHDISAVLSVRCLQGYPYKCPKLQIVPDKGLVKADADNLLSLLYDQANSNAREGRVMIYNLVEAAQEFLSEIFPRRIPSELIPVKVQVFSWTVGLGKLQTCDTLQRKRSSCALSLNRCGLCRNKEEDQDHLLLHCPFTYGLWSRVLQELGYRVDLSKKVAGYVSLGVGSADSKESRSVWFVVVYCIFWSIWLERNNRIFNDLAETVDEVWEKIKFRVAIWTTKLKDFNHLLISDVVRDWKF